MNRRSIATAAALVGLTASTCGISLPAWAAPNPSPNWVAQYSSSEYSTFPPGNDGWLPVTPEPLPDSQPPFILQSRLLLRAGDRVSTAYREAETIYLDPNETRPFTLQIDTAIRDAYGSTLIPAGSLIAGQFQPAGGGTQFVADALVVGDRSFPLAASSEILAARRDPRQVSTGAILTDAAIGAGAGAVLGGILGDRAIATEEVLGAAAAGVLIGNVTAPKAILIRPDTLFDLRLTQDLQAAI
jgi:hypothetical protein